jgi:lipid II:glycine glycyltransferase (peptidoglycan interpeptide bridge formation enzyme)
MKIITQQITDQQTWENYFTTRPEANLLQSWEYGLTYELQGKEILRLGIYTQDSQGEPAQDKLIGIALAIKEEAKRGTYLSIPGGPLIDWDDAVVLQQLTPALKTLAEQAGADFIRIRPQALDSEQIREMLKQSGWNKAPVSLEAQHTLTIDLSQTEEEIVSGMRKNTRYEVRKADKIGIKTEISTSDQDLTTFLKYMHELGKKQNFTPFSDQLIRSEFEAFSKSDSVILASSYLDQELLASAFVVFSNQKAAYRYGISTEKNYRLPGAYAVQKRVIQEAKRRGCSHYNLWGGIVPEGVKNHRFSGIDIFKRGFGGKEIFFTPAHDLPLTPKYQLTRAFELARKKLRKL